MAELLNTEVHLSDGACALVADEIRADEPQTEFVLLDDRLLSVPIWVRDDDAEEVRSAHPSLKIFGFWQTLIANAVLDLNAPLLLYPTGERSGLFLVCEGGRPIRSGRYAGNRTPHDVDYQLADGRNIDVDLSALRAPNRAVRLPREILADSAVRQRAGIAYGVALAVAFASVGGVLAWHRYSTAQQRIAERDDLTTQLAAARSRLNDAQASHRPAGVQHLDRVQSLIYALDLEVKTGAAAIERTALTGGGFAAEVEDLFAQPEWATTIVPQPDGSYEVSYAGSGAVAR